MQGMPMKSNLSTTLPGMAASSSKAPYTLNIHTQVCCLFIYTQQTVVLPVHLYTTDSFLRCYYDNNIQF
jgi:hypothetical protein